MVKDDVYTSIHVNEFDVEIECSNSNAKKWKWKLHDKLKKLL